VVGRSAESVARTMVNKPQPKEQENGWYSFKRTR
jgi:hypothetical protein